MDPVLPYHQCSAVRPKQRCPDVHQQNQFMRGNTIIRSKTFSPGPQSQYICRVSRVARSSSPSRCSSIQRSDLLLVSPDKPQ